MRIFVTGGAGYVGSHCCKAFAEQGHEIVVYDNLTRGWRDMVKWGPLIAGDILDRTSLESALQSFRPDLVAHFAALTCVAESVAEPAGYYRNNVAGSLRLLEAMRAAGVSNLLFSSSAAVYGIPRQAPVTEDHACMPVNPYGWTKLFVERMLRDFSSAYGLRYVALRYFNAAGADPDDNIGERHQPETHAIPLAIQAALRGETFRIFGNDYDTHDGSAIRDYLHVSDLADAHARAASYLRAGGASAVFNLGTGSGTSVKEIADAIEDVSGRPLACRLDARRPGDPPVLVASNALAREKLGWNPRRSIQDIVRTAWRWHESELRRGGRQERRAGRLRAVPPAEPAGAVVSARP